ncbi:ATP-dependent Clp protease adapter protein CLPS1, chloroplastic isoform X2 [Sorghum bicolor]|uniref:ATP-dependent Clp protease adapter protein CLPS1, chloroplastic isoform X2 n=1 Tax=Sorghum bicolor TaxID=4558 RepID=UPI000B423ADD|nr:ATP-dependent Clp protease adapter protein CLPS1, chloroplastic isoform X2 [Sorghum bicolor]|eukprot:XP_021320786.1 ATP-dependent Clp protease adapter protein CLPS1, chloroplastic isoform X2 [Sorghum bicolor]
MEAAVPSRVALSAASRLPNRHAVAGDRSFVYKGRCQSLAIPMALSAAAPGKGGVLDRPVEKTTPGRQSEFDVKLQAANIINGRMRWIKLQHLLHCMQFHCRQCHHLLQSALQLQLPSSRMVPRLLVMEAMHKTTVG